MRLLVLLVALGCVIPWGTAEAENDQATGACFGKLREALEEIDTLQDELSDLKHIAAFSNDSLTLCKQELDNLEDFKRAAEQTDTQADAYKKQLEEAKIILEELQHELEKTVSAAEYDKKSSELRGTREMLRKAEAEVESLTAELQHQKREVARVHESLETLRQEEAGMKAENGRLQKRLDQTRSKIESIPGLHDQISVANAARQEAQDQVAALQAELQQLQHRLEDTASKAETLSELEARLEQTEGARLAAIDAQQRAEQQLAATQQTLSQLLEAIAQREQYEVLRRQYVTAVMPYWMEARWNATREAATGAALAAYGAMARAVAAHTHAVHRSWVRHVEPAVTTACSRLVITGNRLRAGLKGWWVHRVLPLAGQAEAVMEAQLGEAWPWLKQASARAAASVLGWARHCCTLCWQASRAAHANAEAVVVRQMGRVPALKRLARSPYATYLLATALLVLLASAALVVRVMRPAPERPRKRQFIPKADAGAQLRTAGAPLSPKKED